jgi:outer membrane protein assembly factor BamB
MKKAIIFALSLLFLVSCTGILDKGPTTTISHVLLENPYLDVKWAKSDIQFVIAENMTTLATAPNRLLALGTTNTLTCIIYAFDSVTGTLVWDSNGLCPPIIATHNATLYTTDLNTIIYAYNTEDGKLLWVSPLRNAGQLISMTFYKDKIFAYSGNGTFFTMDSHGKMLESKGPYAYPSPIIVEDDVTYGYTTTLVAMNTKTGEILWKAPKFDLSAYSGLLFDDEIMYLREGSSVVPGNIYAIDKKTGKTLWTNNEKTISNLCSWGSNIYFLTWDGYLIGVDKKSGQEISRVEFSKSPFNLPSGTRTVGGYYVAADSQNNIIFVSLGDSHQLFALQLKIVK